MSLGQVYANLNVIRVRRGHPARYKSFFKKNPLIVKSAQPLKINLNGNGYFIEILRIING